MTERPPGLDDLLNYVATHFAATECEHRCDTWFDRTTCPEPCGSMHDRCVNCGDIVGDCTYTYTYGVITREEP